MLARSPTSQTTGTSDEFQQVFAALRAILVPYEARLKVKHDKPGDYYLETRGPGPRKVPLMFAATKINKGYVSYHLMPVYMAELGISPALKKRMQGKACFNFSSVDPPLFEELAAITRQGFEGWKTQKWVD